MFWVPFNIFSEVESLGRKADSFLIFWGISILLFTVAAPVCIPTNSAKMFPFLRILASTCWFIDDTRFGRCKVTYHCGFNFISVMISDSKHTLIYLLATCMCSLEKYLLRSFAHFLIGFFFFSVEFYKFFINFGY